jgi:hypothetical protein
MKRQVSTLRLHGWAFQCSRIFSRQGITPSTVHLWYVSSPPDTCKCAISKNFHSCRSCFASLLLLWHTSGQRRTAWMHSSCSRIVGCLAYVCWMLGFAVGSSTCCGKYFFGRVPELLYCTYCTGACSNSVRRSTTYSN